MNSKNSLVSIIIPAYKSYENLRNFLDSSFKSEYKNFEIIINDDNRTSDETPELVNEFRTKGVNIAYIRENHFMAQARKRGSEFAKGDILIHLDSDMKLTEGLIGECVDLISRGYDALVIPEESFGTTFWARCKWLEKKCYENVEEIESLRCIKKDSYIKLGGHDTEMIFSEDKDLDIRVKKAGYKVGRTMNFLWHNEGNLSLIKTIKKKKYYSSTAEIFRTKHQEEFKWQTNLFNRYFLYLKNIKYFFKFPLVYAGMLFMKTCEFGFGGLGYFLNKIK